MKKKLVLTSLPVRFPIQSTILYSFLLHYFNADNIYWGIFITLYSILWSCVFYIKSKEQYISLNSGEKEHSVKENVSSESKFRQKLNELIEKNKNE